MPTRILVADDEEFERRALRHILGGSGLADLEVVEASNGREAVEAVRAGRFDAVFLDIRMPGTDGIEAARAIREASPGLPIVFLTAHDRFDYARSALRLRVEDFLLKPASAPEVLAALERALASGAGAAGDGARVAEAAAFLAETIRGELAQGRVNEAAMERYRALVAGAGSIVAVVALRCAGTQGQFLGQGHGQGFGQGELGRAAALRLGITSLERGLGAKGLGALGGAGGERGLCVAFTLKTPPIEDRLCDVVMEAAGAVVAAVGDSAGASLFAGVSCAVAGGRSEAIPRLPAAAELSRAAASAASLAGPGRPVVPAHLAAAEEGGQGGGAAGQASSGQAGHGVEERGVGDRATLLALAIMEERLAEDLSLETVAAGVGVSPSHLSRLLARRTGMGFSDCLARLRVERAKSYLASGSMSVKEAAGLVGFRDPAYFARVFKRFAGASPAEWRGGAREGGGGPEASGPGKESSS
jgi:CheY-like chemotaxis protein/AraC-like DNA-binding protein